MKSERVRNGVEAAGRVCEAVRIRSVREGESGRREERRHCERALQQLSSELLEVLLGENARARVHRELHLTQLLVDLLHERDHEIHQLILVHHLRLERRDQE